MINWYHILIASLLLLAFICLKEWKRKNRKRVALRLLVSVVAVLTILLLAYPFRPAINNNKSGKIILLTDGYSPDSMNNLLSGKRNPVYTTALSVAKASRNSKTGFVADLKEFAGKHTNDTIAVYGNGFEKEELEQLNGLSFYYHIPQVFPAITSVYWKQQLQAGEALLVQGRYLNSSAKEVKLILHAFGENHDSLKIAANTQTGFSLTTIPKHAGRAVYSLLAITGKDTLQNEPLPLNIQAPSPFRILLLSSAPDFEKTFLKNKLSRDGYEITASTAVSRNRSVEQFINMPSVSSGLFSLSGLEKFDVVIADDDAIGNLSTSQSRALRSAIEEKGTGLVVKISNEKNSSSFYSHFFSSYPLQQDKKPYILIHSFLNDSNSYKLKMEEPVCLRSREGTQTLLKDEQSNIYAASVVYGQGKIVATTLNNTYTLALAGDNTAWQSLWSLLLGKAARKNLPEENWFISPALSFVNEPSSLITLSDPRPLQARVGEAKIDMQADTLLPWQWQGTYWPTESGWQSLVQPDGKIQYWYAFDKNDWKILKDYHKIIQTKQYAQMHPPEFSQQTAGQNNGRAFHWKLYLVIVLLICWSVLWIEQKLG